jgi:hypothetical protein
MENTLTAKSLAMKAYGGGKIKLHTFLFSVLDGDEFSASRIGRYRGGERGLQCTLDRRLGGLQSMME